MSAATIAALISAVAAVLQVVVFAAGYYILYKIYTLNPRGRVTAYWDDLNNLVPLLKERGLEEGIAITTRYEDLAGERYETEWRVNPLLYQDDRYVYDKDISDLVDAVESLRDGENLPRKRYKPGPLDAPSKTLTSPTEPHDEGPAGASKS